MTLGVSLSPQAEVKLRERAAAVGQPLEVYASHVLEQVAAGASDDPTVALLRSWNIEDATTDPAEISRRQRDWEEFATSINQNHSSNRKVYP